jgi:hypothetical protein
LKKFIGDKSASKAKRYPHIGEGEEMSEDDARRIFGAEYDSAS